MCGIFGVVSRSTAKFDELFVLAQHSEQRGKDSSGLFISNNNGYDLYRDNTAISALLNRVSTSATGLVMGHSRLITNGLADNQPVYRDGVCVIHNGIVVNHESLWLQVKKKRYQEIDTEIIAAIAAYHLETGGVVESIALYPLHLARDNVLHSL
jgi:glucosamine 6-phosphate synthetase-like amidotransferase/phosphosugar isomerase protein